MPRKDRVDKPEKLRRVRIVMEYLLQGQDTIDIGQSICAQWGIGERMARHYIKAAREEIRKSTNYDIAQRIGWHIKTRERLIKKWGDTNPKLALEALNSLAQYEKDMGVTKVEQKEEVREKATFIMPDGSKLQI